MAQGMNGQMKIPKRILGSVLMSLKSGVVPRAGAPYIAIGRQKEIEALVSDLQFTSDGGSAMKFIIGRYGSGKSFLLQLVRGYATERGFVSMDADLSPERRLYGSGGTGLATYRELIKNLSVKTSPDGGGLHSLVERQLTLAREEAARRGVEASSEDYSVQVGQIIREQLRDLRLSVGGFDFCEVLTHYLRAALEGDDFVCAACLRWLRGEYSTKSEAKRTLGFSVSMIADDDNWYDFIKLWAVYARVCGYRGLIVMLDECVNLYKITNRISRENNYEKLLSMFNDTLGNRAPGLMMVMCGTPQFLEDSRRGLFGYEALRSRLCDSRFADASHESVNGPVIRLRRLSDDEMFALLLRVKGLYSQMYEDAPDIKNEDIERFYTACTRRAGASEMLTPREMIRDFLYILDMIREDPGTDIITLIGESIQDAGNSESGTDGKASVRVMPSPEDIEI